jgi:hypothetical protein
MRLSGRSRVASLSFLESFLVPKYRQEVDVDQFEHRSMLMKQGTCVGAKPKT